MSLWFKFLWFGLKPPHPWLAGLAALLEAQQDAHREACGSLVGLVEIRRHAAKGRYDEPHPLDFECEVWSNPAAESLQPAGGA